MLTDIASCVGPATVVELVGDRVRLTGAGGESWARLALAQPYEPAPGDIVLAIAGEETYVIGVLLGRGKTVFRAPGDLELHARGVVDIVSEAGVQLRAPSVRVEADRVETVARACFEKFVDCWRWVKESFQTHAGRSRTVVDGDSTLQAERIVELAERDVRIDAEKIKIG